MCLERGWVGVQPASGGQHHPQPLQAPLSGARAAARRPPPQPTASTRLEVAVHHGVPTQLAQHEHDFGCIEAGGRLVQGGLEPNLVVQLAWGEDR